MTPEEMCLRGDELGSHSGLLMRDLWWLVAELCKRLDKQNARQERIAIALENIAAHLMRI